MRRQRELQKDITLMQAFSNLKGGMFRIDEERDQANKAFRDSKQLRDDYSDGGRAMNLFNQKIANRRADLEGNIDLQNLGGYFKQQALDRAHRRAAYTWTDGLADAFKGFNTGWSFGSGIANFNNNWGVSGSMRQTVSNVAGIDQWRRKYQNPMGSMFG